MRASAKGLRYRTGELLKSVALGEEVLITQRGKLCAKLAPVPPSKAPAKSAGRGPGFGIWKGREDLAHAQAWVREIGKSRF